MNIKLHILELAKPCWLTTPNGKISVVILLENSSEKKVEIDTTQGQESYWVHKVWSFELQGGESIRARKHNIVMMLLLCMPVSEHDQPQIASGEAEAGTTERDGGRDEGGVIIGESRGEGA